MNSVLLLVLCLCDFSTASVQNQKEDSFFSVHNSCYPDSEAPEQLFLLFMLDCSRGVDNATWKQSVAFAKNLSEEVFKRSFPYPVTIGVVFFSTNPWMEAKLGFSEAGDAPNLEKVHEALKSPRCSATQSSPLTPRTSWNFDDFAARKVTAVVLTNGWAEASGTKTMNSFEKPHVRTIDHVLAKSITGIRYSDVEIYAIGIGPFVNRPNLNSIPTKPGSAFIAADYGHPTWLSQMLAQKILERGLVFTPELAPNSGGSYVYINIPKSCLRRGKATVTCIFGDTARPVHQISNFLRPLMRYYFCVTPPRIRIKKLSIADESNPSRLSMENSRIFWEEKVNFSVQIQLQESRRNVTLLSTTPFYFFEAPFPSNALFHTLPTELNGRTARVQWVKDAQDTTRRVDIYVVKFDRFLVAVEEELLAANVKNSGDWVGIARTAVQNFTGLYTLQIRRAWSVGFPEVWENHGPPYWTELRMSKTSEGCALERNIPENMCAEWLMAQEDMSWLEDIRDIYCPPTSLCAQIDRDNFYPDPTCCNQDIDPRCRVSKFQEPGTKYQNYCPYNPGVDHCYNSRPGYEGSRQQCCYQRNNATTNTFDLVIDPLKGAGRAHKFHGQTLEHNLVEHAQLPWTWCCEGRLESEQCQEFFVKRPPASSEGYASCNADRGIGFGFGDPHFITFDKLQYTFTGRGEFVLVRSIEPISMEDTKFEIQVRLGSVHTSGTRTKGLAVRYACSESDHKGVTIAVYGGMQRDRYPYRDSQVGVFVNTDFIDPKGKGLHEYRLVCNNRPDQEFRVSMFLAASGIIIEGPGVSVSIKIDEGTYCMSYSVEVQASFRGRTEGLLGNWNGRVEDDLQPNVKHGEEMAPPIPLSCGLEIIHKEFGLTWNVPEKQSLFDYFGDPQGYNRTNDLLYQPPWSTFKMRRNLSAKVVELCGDSFACRFDALVSGGDLKIAERTLAAEQHAKEIVSNITSITAISSTNDTIQAECQIPILVHSIFNPGRCALPKVYDPETRTCITLKGFFN